MFVRPPPFPAICSGWTSRWGDPPARGGVRKAAASSVRRRFASLAMSARVKTITVTPPGRQRARRCWSDQASRLDRREAQTGYCAARPARPDDSHDGEARRASHCTHSEQPARAPGRPRAHDPPASQDQSPPTAAHDPRKEQADGAAPGPSATGQAHRDKSRTPTRYATQPHEHAATQPSNETASRSRDHPSMRLILPGGEIARPRWSGATFRSRSAPRTRVPVDARREYKLMSQR
jgi:hypothetical protein